MEELVPRKLRSGNPAPRVAPFLRRTPEAIASEAMAEVLAAAGGWRNLQLDNQTRRYWSRRGPKAEELVKLGIPESQAFLTLLAQKMSKEGYTPGEHEFPWEAEERRAREMAQLEEQRREVVRFFEEMIPGGIVHLEWWSGAIPTYRGSYLQRGGLRWEMLPSLGSDPNYHFRWAKPSGVEIDYSDGEDDLLSFIHED